MQRATMPLTELPPARLPAAAVPRPWAVIARLAVLITLAIGVYVHVTRLFIGNELLIERIYTARFDALFAIPMLIGAATILPGWRQFNFRGRFERVVVAVTGLYFLASIPLHVQTLVTGSTRYVLVFPMWYSFVFLAYASGLIAVWSRLRVRDDQRA
jgi:hypothetical protein